ncbi:MAG: hypothetical protein ACYDBV_11200 [Nitrospiria bacterium]
MAENANVDAVVNAVTFLGGAFKLGKNLVGTKFNIFNLKQDIELVQEAEAAFNFVGQLPQIESELVNTITPEQAKEISDAIVSTGLLAANANVQDAVTEGIVLANEIKNYCQKYF